ncbi:uroporphyrinogen decarboxylase [Platysternon megacephalum]|uniref:Uroporphyrinogen decarboxylase n=1 Tax=Platysternon megacephalum TaxID=55544 RepID=A0A4D9DZ81_9SAUR|nr:uroporphyrinogen decarboxylase [Platysternon megacephalum]
MGWSLFGAASNGLCPQASTMGREATGGECNRFPGQRLEQEAWERLAVPLPVSPGGQAAVEAQDCPGKRDPGGSRQPRELRRTEQ